MASSLDTIELLVIPVGVPNLRNRHCVATACKKPIWLTIYTNTPPPKKLSPSALGTYKISNDRVTSRNGWGFEHDVMAAPWNTR